MEIKNQEENQFKHHMQKRDRPRVSKNFTERIMLLHLGLDDLLKHKHHP